MTHEEKLTAFVERLARMETIDDRAIRDAITEYDITRKSGIVEHIEGYQVPSEIYYSNTEAMDRMIREARELMGAEPDKTILDEIESHPEYRALSIEDSPGPD